MGKLARGFLGGFQGQLGTAYGCFWRLMDLVKAMPRKSNRPATAKQLDTQAKLSLMASWLSWAGSIINACFLDKKSNQSGLNAAVAYNLEHAITGTMPNYTIDYPNVVFGTGKLSEALNPEVSVTNDAEINISWELDTPGTPNSNPTDQMSIIVYNPAKEKFLLLKNVVARSVQSYDLFTPVNFSGDSVHVYVGMLNEDGNKASKTQYLGAVIVQ